MEFFKLQVVLYLAQVEYVNELNTTSLLKLTSIPDSAKVFLIFFFFFAV